MAKKTPLSVSSGFASQTQFNAEFADLADHLNNKVLYRTNPSGEANQMGNDLDMNSNRILNLPAPVNNSEAARLQDVINATAGATVANLISYNLTGELVETGSMQGVDGITELRGLTPAANYYLYLRYHTSVGDGGHGEFRGITGAAPGTYVDNGGTIIVPTGGDGSAAWLRDVGEKILSDWFGMDKTGVSNATTAMLAFYNLAITHGAGHISKGTYLITEGVLSFDNGWVDTPFPTITTDGFNNVFFKAANSANSPLLSITNGTATGGTYNLWRGGYHGGITFLDTSGATAASRHGMLLRGMLGTRFGPIKGSGLRADVIHIENKTFSGSPDVYNIALCEFEHVEGESVQGIVFNNDNGVGLTNNNIASLRAADCVGGVFRGFGSSNSIGTVSIGNCSGWAFDDPNATSSSRFSVGSAEIDNVQYGIRANTTNAVTFDNIRFIHRYNFGLNLGGLNYWPREVFSIGYTTSPNIVNISFNVYHRLSTGGISTDLGTFYNFNSAGGNIVKVSINQRIQDDAAFALADTAYYTGLAANSFVDISTDGREITDQRRRAIAVVTSSSAVSIVNSGFGTAAAKVSFPTEAYDRQGYYDTANSWFTAPFSGIYEVTAHISIALATGTRVRLSFYKDVAGALTSLIDETYYSGSGGAAATYGISGYLSLNQGDRLFLMADQNTAGSVALSSGSTANRWSVESVGAR